MLEVEKKGDAVIEGSFKRINNQAFDISTKEQTKTLMTCTDNKRWILDDNVHTLAFGHYRLKDMKRRSCFYFGQNRTIIEVMVGFRYMHGLIQVNTVNRRTLTEREAMRGMSL